VIGVFDSGSGGLTILRELVKIFPDLDFTYLGDHANAPYGHRSNSQIVDMTTRGVDALMAQGCRLVILACNTAAAVALRTIQQGWLAENHPENRVLGVLVPMVEAVTGVRWHHAEPREGSHLDDRTVLLFATQKTIASGAYSEEVSKRAPGLTWVEQPCPGLVDAIEGAAGPRPLKGLVTGFVDEAMDMLDGQQAGAVVLGCTHFPMVEALFQEALPQDTHIYSQPLIVAEAVSNYLRHHPEFVSGGTGQVRAFTTGQPASLAALDSTKLTFQHLHI
jgi:glutamate racemase